MTIMGKKHKPHKKNDKNALRCILLNINEGIESYCCDYDITEERFKALLKALEENEIVSRYSNDGPISTGQFIISNPVKFDEWNRSKTGLYRAMDKYVVPVIQLGTEVLKHIPTPQG